MLAGQGDRWGSPKRSLTVCHASRSIVTDLLAIAPRSSRGQPAIVHPDRKTPSNPFRVGDPDFLIDLRLRRLEIAATEAKSALRVSPSETLRERQLFLGETPKTPLHSPARTDEFSTNSIS